MSMASAMAAAAERMEARYRVLLSRKESRMARMQGRSHNGLMPLFPMAMGMKMSRERGRMER